MESQELNRESRRPATAIGSGAWCRELELEVDRLKRLVAELLLDKSMLQDIAKKSGEPRPAASRR
jgi:hypothetical protein